MAKEKKDTESKNTGFFSKIALLFTSHYSMERFMIFTVIGVMLVASSFTVGLHTFITTRGDILETRSTYSTEVTFSKSGIGGNIVDAYTNESYTRGVVLFDFSDNIGSLSTDASKYQVFVTGSQVDSQGNVRQQRLSNKNIDGQFYVLGPSGYMAVVMDAPDGFDKQILKLTVRSNEELVTTSTSSDDVLDNYSDSSYVAYDQFDAYVNMGAEQTIKLESLDEAEFNPESFYMDAIAVPAETNIKANIEAALESMQLNIINILEYERRLDDAGVVVADRPSTIGYDTISTTDSYERYKANTFLDYYSYLTDSGLVLSGTYSYNDLSFFDNDGNLMDPAEVLANVATPDVNATEDTDASEASEAETSEVISEAISEIASEATSETDSEIASEATSETADIDNNGYFLTLNSDYVVPGGIYFDWMDGSIKEGYLDNLILKTDDPTMSYDDFFRKIQNSGNEDDTMYGNDVAPVWYLDDGTAVESMDTTSSSVRYDSISSDIATLQSYYATFYETKVAIETDYLPSLLHLEADTYSNLDYVSVGDTDDYTFNVY